MKWLGCLLPAEFTLAVPCPQPQSLSPQCLTKGNPINWQVIKSDYPAASTIGLRGKLNP